MLHFPLLLCPVFICCPLIHKGFADMHYLEFRVLQITHKHPIVRRHGTKSRKKKLLLWICSLPRQCVGAGNFSTRQRPGRLLLGDDMDQFDCNSHPDKKWEVFISVLLWFHLFWCVSRALCSCQGYRWCVSQQWFAPQSWWGQVICVGEKVACSVAHRQMARHGIAEDLNIFSWSFLFLLYQYLPWCHWVFTGKQGEECAVLSAFSFCRSLPLENWKECCKRENTFAQ